MTIAGLLAQLTIFYDYMITLFTNIIDMVVGNPLVFTPVLLAMLGGVVMFVMGLIRKLGVRGVSSGGRRRRGRR